MFDKTRAQLTAAVAMPARQSLFLAVAAAILAVIALIVSVAK